MNTTKRINYQALKKFFEPIRTSPMMRAVVIHPLLAWFIVIAIVEVMRKSIEYVQIWDLTSAKAYLYYFIVAISIRLISRTISKNRWYAEIRPKWQNNFYKRYLEEYVSLDNIADSVSPVIYFLGLCFSPFSFASFSSSNTLFLIVVLHLVLITNTSSSTFFSM